MRIGVVILAAVALVGAKCSESEQCKAAKQAQEVACAYDQTSAACEAAKQAVANLCKPAEEPPPTTLPPPTTTTTTVPPPPPTTLPPPPASACPPVSPEAQVYMNNAPYGQGFDSTVRVRGDREFCFVIHGVRVDDCHLDGMPAPWNRLECEMELLGKSIGKAQACPVWESRTSADPTPRPCTDGDNGLGEAGISCDHFGKAGGPFDDPKTAVFEGEPKVCAEQQDQYGPMAGPFTIAHGLGEVRACVPNRTGCGPWRKVDH